MRQFIRAGIGPVLKCIVAPHMTFRVVGFGGQCNKMLATARLAPQLNASVCEHVGYVQVEIHFYLFHEEFH